MQKGTYVRFSDVIFLEILMPFSLMDDPIPFNFSPRLEDQVGSSYDDAIVVGGARLKNGQTPTPLD